MTTPAPMNIWFCKIGEVDNSKVPRGADGPMREAVERAYQEITGEESEFLFSGWGAELTEGERAVVENRLPNEPPSNEILVAISRPEGYEDVSPELVIEDFGIHPAFRWRVVESTAPDGMALVPIEPTQAMLDANGVCVCPDGKAWLEKDARETWTAMLNAYLESGK